MLKDRIPRIDKDGIVRLDFPAEIAIETHSFCNLECVVCPHVVMKRPKGRMSPALFKKIVDQVAQISPQTRLWLAVMGEPCLDQNIIAHCEYVQSKGLNRIHLNSNGTFLSNEHAEAFLRTGVESIYIAIDAVSKDTYDIVRPKGDFERTVRNVENLLKKRASMKGNRTEVVVQFIVMNENENEIEAFQDFWHARGAVVKLRLRQGWGRMISTPDLDRVRLERFPCPWLIRTMNIHWSGHVTQCDPDYEENYPAGDINVQSIAEVWHGELAQRRERHWNGDFNHPLCKNCFDWAAGRAEFFYPDTKAADTAPRWSLGQPDAEE